MTLLCVQVAAHLYKCFGWRQTVLWFPMRLLLLALVVTCVVASQTVYYRRALDPVPDGCTVFGTRSTVCHLADDKASAPEPGGYDSIDVKLTTTPDDDQVATQAVSRSWGQDRVDQRMLPLDNQYTPDRTGAGVVIWVVSTGVDTSVSQFTGRATNNFASSNPPTDCNGRGTELAVVAAGSTYGIATAPFIRGVKIFGCGGGSGSGDLVDGLAYILNNSASRNVVLIATSYIGRKASVEAVIEDLLAADMTVVAEAGDLTTSACNFFPASQDDVISVTSSTAGDKRYDFANYGSCVDIIAPGRKILTKTLGGANVTRTGTDMAAAHVAGAAAMVLQGNPNFNGTQVLENLLARATLGEIGNRAGTPDVLLYVLQGMNPPQTTITTTTGTTGGGASALAVNVVACLAAALVLL